jgi:hypothetical protein
MAAMIENAMVIGDYQPNWQDATDEDFDLRVAEIEDELRNERRAELIDDLQNGTFAETVANILLSTLSGEDKLSEIRDAFERELTALATYEASQE